ncbi:MAG: 3'(2'),5'-bisphosphate nucleotidase CysQ, partial [Pseudomonadota bacterium]
GENIMEDNYDIINNASKYWLIDPLDGTKSFISSDGDYTINIALIIDNKPVYGFIYAPINDVLYYTNSDIAAVKVKNAQDNYNELGNNRFHQLINVQPINYDAVKIVASKSHNTKETDDFNQYFANAELISAASSIKLCLVAEGKADIYPRFGPTMEWDIGAGHAILNAAGGKIIALDKEFVMAQNINFYDELRYGKETLLNGNFIAASKNFFRDICNQ